MTQRSAAIFLVILYLVVLFRPGLPRLLFEMNKSYIQSDLCEQRAVKGNCCKGSCFMRKNLVQDEQRRLSLDTLLSEQLLWVQLHPQAAVPVAKFPPRATHWHVSLDNSQQDQFVGDLRVPPPWNLPAARA